MKIVFTLKHMHLTDEQLSTFQTLYKEKFGEFLSKEEALEKALHLMSLIKLLIPKSNK